MSLKDINMLPKFTPFFDIIKVIEEGTVNDFITFAKHYTIFQTNNNGKLYKLTCDKIKARCDREGLSYETVRPD